MEQFQGGTHSTQREAEWRRITWYCSLPGFGIGVVEAGLKGDGGGGGSPGVQRVHPHPGAEMANQ